MCEETEQTADVDQGAVETTTRVVPVKEVCDDLRADIKALGTRMLELQCHSGFESAEDYVGQQKEMRINIDLAYRHLEDARMRVGKALQAADDGVSNFDK